MSLSSGTKSSSLVFSQIKSCYVCKFQVEFRDQETKNRPLRDILLRPDYAAMVYNNTRTYRQAKVYTACPRICFASFNKLAEHCFQLILFNADSPIDTVTFRADFRRPSSFRYSFSSCNFERLFQLFSRRVITQGDKNYLFFLPE
jgi:hypothetical protein